MRKTDSLKKMHLAVVSSMFGVVILVCEHSDFFSCDKALKNFILLRATSKVVKLLASY